MTDDQPTERSQAYQDDRAHVFHSWSAQKALDPLVVAGRRGQPVLDRRRPDASSTSRRRWSTSTSATSTRRWSPRSRRRPSVLCTIAPGHANDKRGELARRLAEPRARRPRHGVLHQRRRRGHRERGPHGAACTPGGTRCSSTYRSYHGGTSGAITMTGDPRRWASEPGMPGVVHFWGPYLYRSPFHATNEAEECERALAAPRGHDHGRGPGHGRRDHPRDRRRHQRHPRAARRLPRRRPRASATATAS